MPTKAIPKSSRNADYALLHAKKNGKNRVVVFSAKHAKDAAQRYEIEQALRVADFDQEIELLFQPQYDLSQNEIVRAEALARWNSPVIGQIAPDQFIKIAEERRSDSEYHAVGAGENAGRIRRLGETCAPVDQPFRS